LLDRLILFKFRVNVQSSSILRHSTDD
jgi:hypothetical protein